MKISVRPLILFLATTTIVLAAGEVRAATDESLGEKLKKLLATPTPTPHKKHKVSPSPSATPPKKTTPKPSPSAKRSPSPSPRRPPSPVPSETPRPSITAKPSPSPSETPEEKAQRRKHAEPAGSGSPGAKRRHSKTVSEDEATPTPGAAETPSPMPTPSPSPSETASISPSESKSKGTRGPVATISASEIAGYDNYPAEVRQVLDRALELTTENLDYKYGSADPASGGMDCSGFIYYVLSQGGMKEVPRDAREQYIWVRKARTFQAVLGHHDDTFELDDLKPGDLLFWSGTYHVDRDPAITHTMIYLGREKGTNQRIMVGSSDGRTYKGQSRFGVSVFDFKVTPRMTPGKSEEQLKPTFVGYGRIPDLKAAEKKGE
jgi:cell wall-associated NlpC family hydrolase